MSLTRVAHVVVLVVVALLAACGSGTSRPPPTGVDLTTPVTALEGWSTLVSSQGLTPAQQHVLATYVDVFRNGLDSSRLETPESMALQSERQMWADARTTVTMSVPAAAVEPVMQWLVARFGSRVGAV